MLAMSANTVFASGRMKLLVGRPADPARQPPNSLLKSLNSATAISPMMAASPAF
jgi:hypothetical protein